MKKQSQFNVPIANITASSNKIGHGPELANDAIYNDANNSWIPEIKPDRDNPQWLLLDFGEVLKVGALEVAVIDENGPKTYEIMVSVDGKCYSTVYTKTVASSRTLFAQWKTTSARYIRLVIIESFTENCTINELTVFNDILPHRAGVLAGFPDMAHFGDNGMAALRREGMQLVNLCVCVADPYSPGINILPDLIDDEKYPNGICNEEVLAYLHNPENYHWKYADTIFQKFIDEGFDIWLGFQGFTERAFPGFYSDIVDESGRLIKHRDFFNDIQNQAVIELAKQTMMHFDNNPHIRCYSILGPGWFGGIEFYSGADPELLAVYSEGAQSKFRTWIQSKYDTIALLNTSWKTNYTTFDEVTVPKPARENENTVDSRPDWADLMLWKIEYMDAFIEMYMTAMRSVSDKPIHVEIDGGYQSAPMETGESIGKIVRDLSKYENIIFGNSNLDASYGTAQFVSTVKFYGVEKGITHDDTGQLEEKKHLNNAFNFLSRGAGTLAHASLGADFNEYKDGSWDPNGHYKGSELYHWTKNNVYKFLLLNPTGNESDVVVFNPWYANLFRKGYNRNNHNHIYDSDHCIQWYGAAFANWTHFLNTPEIMDDFPIEDGALEEKKVLIEPNMDVALTSNVAEEKIKSWILHGGAFVGFGKDCFSYRFNLFTGRLSGGDSIEHWMMGLSGGQKVTNFIGEIVKVSDQAPEWLKSLKNGQTSIYKNTDKSQLKAFCKLEDDTTPVLEDEAGNIVMCEKRVGNGSVLFCTVPIADTAMFYDDFMTLLLADYVDSRKIKRTITYDGRKYHVVDAGIDENTGKRVIEISRNAGTTDRDILIINHDSSLDGVQAILDLNWKKDTMIYYTFEAEKPFVYQEENDTSLL